MSLDACAYETRIHLQVFPVYLFSSSQILNSKCPMGDTYTHTCVCVCVCISNHHIVPFELWNYICQLFIGKLEKYESVKNLM